MKTKKSKKTLLIAILIGLAVTTSLLFADVWFGDYKEGIQGISIIPKGPIVLYYNEPETNYTVKAVFSDGTITDVTGLTVTNSTFNIANNIKHEIRWFIYNNFTSAVNMATYVSGSIFDSDGDKIPDFWEDNHSMNTNDSADAGQDWNSNGFDNLMEFVLGSNSIGNLPATSYPKSNWFNGDDDLDGIPNWWESNYWGYSSCTNFTAFFDSDSDGLTDYEEYVLGTDPTDDDTDNDNIIDSWDINPSGTNPIPVIVVKYPIPGSEI